MENFRVSAGLSGTGAERSSGFNVSSHRRLLNVKHVADSQMKSNLLKDPVSTFV